MIGDRFLHRREIERVTARLREVAGRLAVARRGGSKRRLAGSVEGLRREMREAARELDFERAAELRDRIRALESERLRLG